ncbi:MAG: hypothetical protein KDG50_03730 [Chromatiales bacterium]|nr:hypothetical protein [Chromatiales bacterium]
MILALGGAGLLVALGAALGFSAARISGSVEERWSVREPIVATGGVLLPTGTHLGWLGQSGSRHRLQLIVEVTEGGMGFFSRSHARRGTPEPLPPRFTGQSAVSGITGVAPLFGPEPEPAPEQKPEK